MMEKKFLMHVLYMTLIGIRAKSLENNDRITFLVTDLLHNIPLHFDSDENIKKAYENLKENAKSLGMEKWFEMRENEFYLEYPEFDKMG